MYSIFYLSLCLMCFFHGFTSIALAFYAYHIDTQGSCNNAEEVFHGRAFACLVGSEQKRLSKLWKIFVKRPAQCDWMDIS